MPSALVGEAGLPRPPTGFVVLSWGLAPTRATGAAKTPTKEAYILMSIEQEHFVCMLWHGVVFDLEQIKLGHFSLLLKITGYLGKTLLN